MNTEEITPLHGEIQEAIKNPNGWVYRIEGQFGPTQAIPPEAIVGAWRVDATGAIIGPFMHNPKFRNGGG